VPARAWVPNALSLTRLLLIPILWWVTFSGRSWLVGLGLVLAGLTDFLDGYLARRLGRQSARGARLDSLADNLLLLSALAWLQLLQPQILRDNTTLIAITFAIYAASLATGLIKFHHLGNLHLYSSKVAGGFLYAFAVLTLLEGRYEPLLLAAAAGAFIVSSAETLAAQLLVSAMDENVGSILLLRRRRAEIRTSHAIGAARKILSHNPQSENPVGSNASPAKSIPAAAVPSTTEDHP